MSYSEKFLEIMNSNIRPKCEPKITVSGTAQDGTSINLEWNAKDIKSLTFNRSIDPVGRNLPVMELQWTEVYYGKFDSQNFPIKYSNLANYMAVNLEFHQYLGFYQTWKTLKALTWKEVKNLTWKKVKEEVAFETIKMPTLFLLATPEISGHTIKWKAKDALSFLTEKQQKAFNMGKSEDTTGISLYNPIVYLLINARAGFQSSKELFDYYTRTINYFNELSKTELLKYPIIFDGETNSCIMNYLSATAQYLDFENDKIIKKSFGDVFEQTPVFDLPISLQYGTPTYELGQGMSQYSWKRYVATVQNDKVYTKSADEMHSVGETSAGTMYELIYNYDGYGTAKMSNPSMIEEINQGFELSTDTSHTLQVSPISYEGVSSSLVNKNVEGEVFEEDNKQNVFQIEIVNNFRTGYPMKKYNNLIKYFKVKNGLVKTQTPALFNWEIGTLANCETMLYNENKHMVAKCVLCEMNLQYNGSLKQNIIARQVG